jgi:hypothetical protein
MNSGKDGGSCLMALIVSSRVDCGRQSQRGKSEVGQEWEWAKVIGESKEAMMERMGAAA